LVCAIACWLAGGLFLEIGDKRTPSFRQTEAGTTLVSAGYQF
jgi:hypothetical protein